MTALGETDVLPEGCTGKMGDQIVSVDATHKLEDLSGIVLKPGDNPYAAFIEACNDKPVRVDHSLTLHTSLGATSETSTSHIGHGC